MTTTHLASWAATLADEHMNIPKFESTRWPHIQAVAARAETLASICGPDGELLVAAAWLHDIGYAPTIAVLDFHPIDGAVFLDSLQVEPRLSALVAHHSAAHLDASMRGLTNHYTRWANEDTPVRDALWTIDMTTSPTGTPISFEDRLADITDRYGTHHTVTRAITSSAATINDMITHTTQRAIDCGIRTDFAVHTA